MSGVFVLSLVSKMLMLGVSISLARLMGPARYGVYAAAVALITLIGIPASLGLPNLIVRQVAAYRVHAQWGLAKGLLVRANQAVLVVTVLLGLLLLVLQVLHLLPASYSASVAWLTFALLPITLFGALRMAALRGLHHVVLGLMPETLVMPLVFLLGIWVVHLTSGTFTAELAVGLRLLAYAAAFLVGALLLLVRLPAALRVAQQEHRMREWAAAAGPLLWVGAMSAITTQTDVVMLAAIKSPAEAGIYQVAARGAELVAFVSAISNIALQPTFARLYAAGDLARLKRVTRRAAQIMLAAAAMAAAIFVGAGFDILKTVFGAAYQAGASPLAILSVCWVLVTIAGPARDTLIMSGGQNMAAVSIGIGAMLNLILNFLLITSYSVNGAAIATGISLIACQVGYAIGVRRRLGFWVSPL
jgi:O-antigen/teichoic acid export membrane protein